MANISPSTDFGNLKAPCPVVALSVLLLEEDIVTLEELLLVHKRSLRFTHFSASRVNSDGYSEVRVHVCPKLESGLNLEDCERALQDALKELKRRQPENSVVTLQLFHHVEPLGAPIPFGVGGRLVEFAPTLKAAATRVVLRKSCRQS